MKIGKPSATLTFTIKDEDRKKLETLSILLSNLGSSIEVSGLRFHGQHSKQKIFPYIKITCKKKDLNYVKKTVKIYWKEKC